MNENIKKKKRKKKAKQFLSFKRCYLNSPVIYIKLLLCGCGWYGFIDVDFFCFVCNNKKFKKKNRVGVKLEKMCF